jgi:hypothetical protein
MNLVVVTSDPVRQLLLRPGIVTRMGGDAQRLRPAQRHRAGSSDTDAQSVDNQVDLIDYRKT